MIVYIASPYTIGDSLTNVHRQIDAAEQIADRGHTPIVPLMSHFWHERHPHHWSFWMRMDMELLTTADALLRLPGESAGADLEVDEALHMGIPVYYDVESIPNNV